MPYQSLGEFIKAADTVGEVRYVEGADLDLDVGCLTELTVGRMLINACRPYSWRDQFPRANVFGAAERHMVEAKWHDLLEDLEAKGRLTSTKKAL